ncbi:GDP-L-fucose synthase family protein [Leptonema illini]|uniref:GDP-L-fucose synthase n=1 Tax=Leptonema illini DSM 21528 TaxID=929563 RepID=H2CD36_9LEPT|nr:GDP-L-fucose synthase [Leptonema illini]EHQ07512.1 NAD-dependent epimerase/dehydratase [Leptonema illini DSM 21528]
MHLQSRIFVAGHRGLVGSAIVRRLEKEGYSSLILRTHDELDLEDQRAVADFFERERPEYVFLAAAKVGGILANNVYRADFILKNLQIQNNVIGESWRAGVKKLLFLGSSCIYPKEAPQPMSEDALLTSTLEYTNEPYAIAKIAGIKLCESLNLQYGTNFMSVMPTNLYGPNDNFDLEKSHVLPALLRKMHLARLLREERWSELRLNLGLAGNDEAEAMLGRIGVSADAVEIWGTGRPLREFLHSDDMADACVWLMQNVDFGDLSAGMTEVRNTHINIGSGIDLSIADLASMIREIVGFEGELRFNPAKPDGAMRKLMDVSKLAALGWRAKISLRDGINGVYRQYCSEAKKK